MSRKRLVLNLSSSERVELETIISDETSNKRMVLRCRIILMTEEGVPLQEIADMLGLSKNTVNTWRQIFLVKRIQGLNDKKRKGRQSKKATEVLARLFPEWTENICFPVRQAVSIKLNENLINRTKDQAVK
ncbi:MAG TPA: helix-turn-helix domain-containing protein [Geobacteraceae bacterium]|nr:helix-turn-helix domain-containing protein [Geobacteraceae bacterium]